MEPVKPFDHTADSRIVAFIKGFESLRLQAYQDSVGIWTIGWGCIKYQSGEPVRKGDEITQEQAVEMFNYELQQKEYELNRLLSGIPVNQNQFDALLSFVFNLGSGALQKSTLLKKMKVNVNDKSIYSYAVLNKMPVPDTCEFVKWCHGGGKVLTGLLRRRAAEADMYAGK